jgi:preprotein translocase subunit SecG
MFGVILGIHILVCLSLVIIVLLQSGKGGGLAGAFGGAGGVGAVFGGQAAATFLTKATRYLAVAFMITSLGMAFAIRGVVGGGTVTEGLESRTPAAATSAGEAVPTEATPTGLPGSSEGTQEGTEGTQEGTEGTSEGVGEAEPQGEQVPVVPEGE